MVFPWNLDPEDFTSGWEGEQEFTDPEYGLQFRPVPPPPPVERPTTPLPSAAQDQLTQVELDLMDILDTVDLETTDAPSPDSLDMSPFEGDVLADALEGLKFMNTLHGEKRAASDAVLFGDPSECSNPKKKRRVSRHQTAANKNTTAVSYAVPASSDTSATSSRRQQEDKPYMKKPPNAFMLFRAEQRPKVVQELQITDCAQVNVVLGQRWRMLSEQEKAPYFEQAHRERTAHEAKYPGWSTKDNFGTKRKMKNNGLPNLTNYQQLPVPVVSTSQQPVLWSRFINQAHGN